MVARAGSPSFGRSFSVSLIGNTGAAGLGALAILLSIRQLSPAEWGPVATIIGLGPSLGLVLSLGSVGYQTRRLTRMRARDRRARQYAAFIIRRALVACLVISIGVALVPLNDTLAFVTVLAGCRFFRGGTSILMACEKKFSKIAFLAVAEKATVVVWVVASDLTVGVDGFTLPVAFVGSYTVYSALALFFERPSLSAKIVRLALASPFRLWHGSARFGVSSLVGPLQQADVAVLSAVAGDFQGGLLGAGSRLTSASNVIGSSLASVVMPYFATGSTAAPRMSLPLKLRIAILCFVGASVFIAMSVTTQFWVPLLLGAEYESAAFVVSCYLALAVINMLLPPMMVLLQAWDHEGIAMWYAICQAFFGMMAIGLCGLIWGANGAALGQLVVSAFMVMFLGFQVRRLFRIRVKDVPSESE